MIILSIIKIDINSIDYERRMVKVPQSSRPGTRMQINIYLTIIFKNIYNKTTQFSVEVNFDSNWDTLSR